MNKNDIRLIDEAIGNESVKNTFRLGWEFIVLNKKFTAIAMVIVMILNLLGSLPTVGVLFLLMSGVFSMIIQIYIGKHLYGTDNIETLVNGINGATVKEAVQTHANTAWGAYVGWIFLMMFIMTIFSFFIASLGLEKEALVQMDLLALLNLFSPLIIFILLLSYVQPLVQANIIMANNFQEALKAVFTLFSIPLWKSAFQKKYFVYIAKVEGIIMMAIIAVMSLMYLLPPFSIFLSIFLYIYIVMMSVSAVMAKRMVEELK